MKPASNIERLGGELYSDDSVALADRQARTIARRCAIGFSAAIMLASLVYGSRER